MFATDNGSESKDDKNIIKSQTNLGTYNSLIKEIYGNYNFWSWLRFWFLDSVFKQTIMLMDKTRVDYDGKSGHKSIAERKLISDNREIGRMFVEKQKEKRAKEILLNIQKEKENG